MYYILYAFFYLVSLLPMRILYILSDLMFFVVYHCISYRKKVVFKNLEKAFPEKSGAERAGIAKQFYRNMIDSFIETFKLLSASPRFLLRRVTANWEILEPMQKSGKSCQLHLGHTFNWEWGHHVLQMNTIYQVLVVYGPLSSKAFERLLLGIRTRFGSKFIPASDMKHSIAQYADTQYLLGLVADQSPGKPQQAYWLNFLNQPTAFIPGPEKAARNLNLPVLFAAISKTRRGYYHAELTIASEQPAMLKPGELTLMYARFLEDTIRKQPENWLWSHRRWKHTCKPEYAEQWIGEEQSAMGVYQY
ncbi:MAG: lysophospholipid acyltransferase family protein [Terrimonas sp.]|nr:lysophospholipid acyltransferase family protein [Terrimonas sp.]OJY92840.1 MAG: lipid A biosynthesis acyltransferase [Sphingobacteriales bacterium 40-81]